MIREALEYLVGLGGPKTVRVKGSDFSAERLYRVGVDDPAEPVVLKTLTGLVDFCRNMPEDRGESKYMLVVKSHRQVDLVSGLDEYNRRQTLASAIADTPDITVGSYMDNEPFIIMLQSCFTAAGDRDLLLKFAGTVTSGTVKEYGDDGVTQKATVKTGIASKGEAIVPSPCQLAPYRTFHEVEQVQSTFVFRMRERDGAVQSAIFGADGGAWKHDAMERIRDYLRDELELDLESELMGITVVA